VGGVAGPAGAGADIGGSVLMTDALIRHRDGIVGPWQGANLPVRMPRVEDREQLWRWESWCRGCVFDFELASELRFTKPAADTVRLSDRRGEIVSLTRPPLATFRKQLDHVEKYADLREDRASEILAQIGMQTDFWGLIAYLHPTRTAKTLEVLLTALRLTILVEMRIKHALACPRPLEYSSQIQPMILTPGHGSLPSGHSTQAYLIAEVYWALLPPARKNPLLREQLMRQAARVAINRTVAGVHFPVDSAAGRVLGTTLAEHFISRATRSKFTPRRFKGRAFDRASDFNPADAIRRSASGRPPAYVQLLRDAAAAPCETLAWLWAEARKEWRP